MSIKSRLYKTAAAGLLACVCAFVQPAGAQETPDSSALPTEAAAGFEQALADLAVQEADIARLEGRIATSEGVTAQVFEIRRDRLWSDKLRSTLALATTVADQREGGVDVSEYEPDIIARLQVVTQEAVLSIQRARARVSFPAADATPEQIVIDDQLLFRQVVVVDHLYDGLIDFIDVAERYGVDTAPALDFMSGSLSDTAANRSVFLDLAIEQVDSLRAAAATLPANTDLADRLAAADSRVRATASTMQQIVTIMNRIDLDTRHYRQQLLTVTGEITTDVLDVGIMANLVSEWSSALFDLTATEGPRFVFQLLLVLAILFAFVQVAKLVEKGVRRGLDAGGFELSNLLKRMIVSSAKNLVVILGVLIGISQLGISLGPLLAGLGIAGFIIGFALQDVLSNFASGILILLYRPFDVGDTVQAGGVNGQVSSMSLVNTTFMTFDNQRLVVPNNAIWSSVITNFTAQTTRRVDLTFGIAYTDDIEKALAVLKDIADNYETVLDEPEPLIKVHELGESSVNLILRPWVNTDDYWSTYWDLTKIVKLRFDEEGISIPFPQRDVHIIKEPAV